jgi:hypothetical protein
VNGAQAAAQPASSMPWRRVAAGVLALLFLNGMLSFSTWWPTPGIVPDHRLAPEFVWLWLALLALVGIFGRLPRAAAALLGAAYTVLVLGRYVDVTTPALFGREVNLYWDVPQIPRFLWVTAQDHGAWISAAAVAVVALLLWALYRLLRLAIAVAGREAAPYALRARWAWLATAAAVALVGANYAGVRATWPVVSKPVVPTYWRQAQLLAAAASPERLAATLPRSAALDAALSAPRRVALGGLGGRDVYLIFMESVGAVTYDNPRAAAQLAPARARLAEDIAAGGRQVVSAFLRSPTIGGASDLAHMALLSGIDLADPRRHDLLLTTHRPTLLTLFRNHGYRTFGLYPAVAWQWPERAYYGFDVYLDGPALDYRGPPLGFWKIPDQFALARFEQMFPRDVAEPPRLVLFATITCHLPFSPVPPYQPDWQRVLTEAPFDAAEVARALAERPNWLDMFPDYLRMVEYTYRWLGGFLRQHEPRETVFVLIGDHQPAANVSGEGAPWDVPVHVVTRDAEILARFAAQGFRPGLEPPRAPLGGMHDLTAMLLQGFTLAPPQQQAAGAALPAAAIAPSAVRP